MIVILFIVAVLPVGGFLIGYFVGRKAGRKQATQGFPVVPLADATASNAGRNHPTGDTPK